MMTSLPPPRVSVAGKVLGLTFAASLALVVPARAQAPPDFTALRGTPFDAAAESASAQAHRDMVAIPAGSYPIGRDTGPADQRPRHMVPLAAFRIDRTEVTNAAFAEYLNALDLGLRGSLGIGRIATDGGAPRAVALLQEGREGSGLYPIIALDDEQVRIELRNGRFAAAVGFEDHPVAETTWAGARAYCTWRGARLPTEAEWEAAARGTDDRMFPWGDASPNASRAFVSGRSGVTAPVGGRPAGASAFGVHDMSGSLAEWTSSLNRPFPYDAFDGRELPTAAGERVTRGGDYVYDRSARGLTVSHRNGFSNAPERGHRHIGFRCAAS
jgi:iron(II)-dependent oxidoreductase